MATKTVVNISPKVFTGGLCGLGVAVVEAIIVAVTPHTLAFLGQWEPLALAAIPPLLGQVAAWFKKEQATIDAGTAKTGEAAVITNAHAAPAATPAESPAATTPPVAVRTFELITPPTA